ncbi:MAG: tyrosine-type recombinase/integrase [Candidatus Pacebacteria bacterium]|nr:tyrosine-type recombinase/integrase [Candidatus Paceibacterota bacterium]
MLQYLEDFLLHIQTNNYSPETLYNYERDLKTFENFLDNEIKISFEKADKKTIEQYKAYLVSRDRKTASKKLPEGNLSAGSINRTLSSLRGYLKYLIKMDYPAPVAPDAIEMLRTEKKHGRVGELKDIVRLIELPSSFEKNKKVGIRNRAMLEMVFSTGMRISELVNIKITQIDDTGRIFIRGKGKKERFVYLTSRAYEWIKNYLKEARGDDPSPYLFIPNKGKNIHKKDKKISSNYLQERIKKYRTYLHLNVPTSCHSIRHAFATYLAENGANPAAIQILLGHESLDTTTRYVHASDKYAEKSHHDFHPLKD